MKRYDILTGDPLPDERDERLSGVVTAGILALSALLVVAIEFFQAFSAGLACYSEPAGTQRSYPAACYADQHWRETSMFLPVVVLVVAVVVALALKRRGLLVIIAASAPVVIIAFNAMVVYPDMPSEGHRIAAPAPTSHFHY